MAIDFTKPIHTKQDPDNILKVLFHDDRSIFFENSGGRRFEVTPNAFEQYCENIPEAPKKIKGFIGLFPNGDSTIMQPTVEELKKHYFNTYVDFIAIVEINAIEGEGLQ